MRVITLKRVAMKPDGVYGVFIDENKTPFALSAELPYKNNAHDISCIHKGEYFCKRVVKIQRGECWEVCGVPNREHILIHRGNVPLRDSRGCILIGEQFEDQLLTDGKAVTTAVLDSGKAFSELMQRMLGEASFTLVIEEV